MIDLGKDGNICSQVIFCLYPPKHQEPRSITARIAMIDLLMEPGQRFAVVVLETLVILHLVCEEFLQLPVATVN